MKPLEFIMAEARFSTLKSPLCKHRRQQALPPLGCVVAECSPCTKSIGDVTLFRVGSAALEAAGSTA
jgi:hypothetical protein